MARSPLFWRLTAAMTLGSVAILGALAAALSQSRLADEDAQLRQRLQQTVAAAATVWKHGEPVDAADPAASQFLQDLAQASGLRITLLSLQGEPLADARPADYATHDDDFGRQREFVAAARRGTAWGPLRYGRSPLSLAMRIDADGAGVAVSRAAADPEVVQARRAAIWREAVWTTFAAAGVALVVSTAIAGRIVRHLGGVTEAAEALAAGRPASGASLARFGADEFGRLSRALTSVGRQLHHSQQQLESTSKTQLTVLEGMTECVIAVDRSERVLLANGAAGRALGFPPQRAIGEPLLEAVRSHELRAVARQALQASDLAVGEFDWRGGKRIFSVMAAPLPGDPAPGVVLVIRDVSQSRNLERMRQQFVANVSHELKTPLSSIKAYAETLLAGADKDPHHARRFLERINEQATRMQQLILDMLSLARIESGQQSFDVGPVAVARIIRRCVSDYEPLAAAGRVRLTSRIDDGDLQVQADEEGLWQILSNLIDNAVKYTPPDGTVEVRARREGAAAVIEVADTGVGIAPEHHDRLFERFYRVDRARSRELGGTGLGLSIVKHLSQAMGGTASVRSAPGQGSIFAVSLPLGSSAALVKQGG